MIEILQACVGRGPTELAKGTWISLHFNKVVVNSQRGEPIGMGCGQQYRLNMREEGNLTSVVGKSYNG